MFRRLLGAIIMPLIAKNRNEIVEEGAKAIWHHAGWRPESWDDSPRSRDTYIVEAGLALDAMLAKAGFTR